MWENYLGKLFESVPNWLEQFGNFWHCSLVNRMLTFALAKKLQINVFMSDVSNCLQAFIENLTNFAIPNCQSWNSHELYWCNICMYCEVNSIVEHEMSQYSHNSSISNFFWKFKIWLKYLSGIFLSAYFALKNLFENCATNVQKAKLSLTAVWTK